MSNTNAIVTGGSRGIGRDTVLRLAQDGIRTIPTFNRGGAEADAVVALAGKAGASARAIRRDVTETAGDVGPVIASHGENAQRIEVAGGIHI